MPEPIDFAFPEDLEEDGMREVGSPVVGTIVLVIAGAAVIWWVLSKLKDYGEGADDRSS